MTKTNQGLSEIAKSLKSALTNALLCELVLVTTHITKIHGKHLCKDGMAYNKTCRTQEHIMHTLNMAKMTNSYLV